METSGFFYYAQCVLGREVYPERSRGKPQPGHKIEKNPDGKVGIFLLCTMCIRARSLCRAEPREAPARSQNRKESRWKSRDLFYYAQCVLGREVYPERSRGKPRKNRFRKFFRTNSGSKTLRPSYS